MVFSNEILQFKFKCLWIQVILLFLSQILFVANSFTRSLSCWNAPSYDLFYFYYKKWCGNNHSFYHVHQYFSAFCIVNFFLDCSIYGMVALIFVLLFLHMDLSALWDFGSMTSIFLVQTILLASLRYVLTSISQHWCSHVMIQVWSVFQSCKFVIIQWV